MEIFLLVVHVIVCFVLILSVLLQEGKGGGLAGGAFGGMGGGGAIFGGGGANTFFAKITTYAGIVFALTCVGLWYTGRGTDDSLPKTAAEKALDERGPQPFRSAPTAPVPLDVGGTEQTTPTASQDTTGN